MSSPDPFQQLAPASPSRSESLELKTSPLDEREQEREEKQVKKRGVVDVFLGRDRETLQKDLIVWREGWTPFADSLGRRMQGVLTKRFLYVFFPSLRNTARLALLAELTLVSRSFAEPASSWASCSPSR
jgi:hypothetical protein